MNKIKDSIPLAITIEGKDYEWHKQYITGAEIKQLASIPDKKEIYLSLKDPWDDELISDDTSVNLARPGIESFKVRHPLTITINNISYKWHRQRITGNEIRKLGNIDYDEEIYLVIQKPFQDEKIEDSLTIDLAKPGIEHFISKYPLTFEIIVNGMAKIWNNNLISFDEVIKLAFGNINYNNRAYTVTYANGPKKNSKGSMVLGDNVHIKSKMNFNATATNKS